MKRARPVIRGDLRRLPHWQMTYILFATAAKRRATPDYSDLNFDSTSRHASGYDSVNSGLPAIGCKLNTAMSG